MRVRLPEKYINLIKTSALEVFEQNLKIYIFGSREDMSKRGGDIDIYIKSDTDIDLSKELKFLSLLQKQVIERKIDFVIKTLHTQDKDIFKEAKEKGVML